jgi:hypothetical protein
MSPFDHNSQNPERIIAANINSISAWKTLQGKSKGALETWTERRFR